MAGNDRKQLEYTGQVSRRQDKKENGRKRKEPTGNKRKQ